MSLIDDIRSGSSDAIKQLYQENAQDVYDFAKGITGNHDTAMQATKNTLTKLVQQIQAGDEPANLHSEALKLAYDEACKIAMPSVQNVKSPYEEEEPEETVVRQPKQPKPQPQPQPQQPAARPSRQAAAQPRRREQQYYEEDDYEEDNYEPVQKRAPQRGNRRDYEPRQPERRSSRRDYYEDSYDDRYDDRDRRYSSRSNSRYDDYDDYDEYEKKGRGAGFYVCLIINIILVLLLIWFLIGLLINLGVLPYTLSDTLGYTWFDNHIYNLF